MHSESRNTSQRLRGQRNISWAQIRSIPVFGSALVFEIFFAEEDKHYIMSSLAEAVGLAVLRSDPTSWVKYPLAKVKGNTKIYKNV